MLGTINKTTPSLYQPSDDVAQITKRVKEDYDIGEDILNHQYVELNDRSIKDDENRGQLMFNAFVDTEVEDPNEAWKWRGTRSMARNKGIAMHAQLTAAYLLPVFTAQNEDDEEDRDFSEVMRDVIEWMAEPTNSNYQSSFLQIVFGMITNPVTYLGAEYCEVYQKIKEKKEAGGYTTKEVLDEVLSGFQVPIYSSSQVLITNAFERNMQKQGRIIKRRYVERSSLEGKYGSHKNWMFVQDGIKSVYNEEDGIFYDCKDNDARDNLLAEETWLCRTEDLEICFVNGIYMGDDEVDANPIKHRDNRGAPKYNLVPFGYSRIGEHFFYYKSMMNALGWDNALYDAMSEVVMNRAFLEVEMPIAISGSSDKVDSEIIFPNSVITLEDKDARIQKVLPDSNISAGFASLRETEKSINEGSVNETIGGNIPASGTTAYSIAQSQAAAKKLVLGVGKNLAASMVQYGDLMKDIAINHYSAAQVDELTTGELRLKYRTLLLEPTEGASKMSKKIKFDPDLIGVEMSEEEMDMESVKLLDGKDYDDDSEGMIRVNPAKFAKFRYLTKVNVEEMFPKNSEYWQPILLNLKTTLAKDPFTNQEALTQEIMRSYFQSRSDRFVTKPQPAMQDAAEVAPGGDQFGRQDNQKRLGMASQNAMV